MGNRAVITTRDRKFGVYLHWNGGRDSIEPFLQYCRLRQFRPPETTHFGWARLCQVIGNFMGDFGAVPPNPKGLEMPLKLSNFGLSVGLDDLDTLDQDNGDNGVYVIEEWRIVEREFFDGEEEQTAHDPWEMLCAIDEAQPEQQRLGEELLLELRTKEKELEEKQACSSQAGAPGADAPSD